MLRVGHEVLADQPLPVATAYSGVMLQARSGDAMKLFRSIVRFIPTLAVAALVSVTAEAAPAQILDSDSVNLTGQDFFRAYTSQDVDVREKAKLFLLGVQDSSEGRAWCGYKLLKTVTLQEAVYEHFKKLSPKRLEERAADLIQEMLAKRYPCGSRP